MITLLGLTSTAFAYDVVLPAKNLKFIMDSTEDLSEYKLKVTLECRWAQYVFKPSYCGGNKEVEAEIVNNELRLNETTYGITDKSFEKYISHTICFVKNENRKVCLYRLDLKKQKITKIAVFTPKPMTVNIDPELSEYTRIWTNIYPLFKQRLNGNTLSLFHTTHGELSNGVLSLTSTGFSLMALKAKQSLTHLKFNFSFYTPELKKLEKEVTVPVNATTIDL